MALNGLGSEKRTPPPAPVTLPRLNFKTGDAEREAKEDRQHRDTIKVIKQGRDCWERITEVETFTNWLTIGKALQCGKAHALRVTGANQAWGRNYSLVFCEWMQQYGFGRMQKSVRSVAIELAENADAITAWRDGLPGRQRKRLIHPLSVTRRWRAATQHNGKCPTDLRRDAMAAWRRFLSHVQAMPASEALPLWQMVQTETAARL
jgi:hypothetical protein